MPFSRLCAIPHHVNILLPEFVRETGKVYIAWLACITHAVAQAVDQPEAGLIGRRFRFGFFFETGPSFEVSNFVFPVARAHASRYLPIHKDARPRIELADQFRIHYLDRTFQRAAAYHNFVHRRFLVPHGNRTAEQSIPCWRRRMPFAVCIATYDRASILAIQWLAGTRQIHVSRLATPAITSGID